MRNNLSHHSDLIIISPQNGGSQKLLDKFTYLGNGVPSIEIGISLRRNGLLSISYRLYGSRIYPMKKRNFFQGAVVLMLPYRCTSWTLTKRTEKKIEKNCTKKLQATLNKYRKEHSINSSFTATYIPSLKPFK